MSFKPPVPKRRGRPPGKAKQASKTIATESVNWEELANNLHKSLTSELESSNKMKLDLDDLKHHYSIMVNENDRLNNIVSYLEMKLGLNPV